MKPSTLLHLGLAAWYLSAQGSMAVTVAYVGTETSNGSSYPVHDWSNASVAKNYDIDSNNRYGSAGYYQIRPMLGDPAPLNIYEAAVSGNDLGVSAANYSSLFSKPSFLGSISGSAGTYVNYGGYPNFRGPDGSSLYRQGGLSVTVGTGPYTPGIPSSYFGTAITIVLDESATFRLGVAVDCVADAAYAPNYVSVYHTSGTTAFSTALARNGSPDMTFFDISGVNGDTFTINLWQHAGTQSVGAVSLVTFDVIPEPSSGLLSLIGLTALGILHRRRRTA